MLTFALLIILIVATVVSDYFGEPPNYLVGLLGTAAGAFFTAIGSDKNKREAEVAETALDAKKIAQRAERKVEEASGDAHTEVDRRDEDVGGGRG